MNIKELIEQLKEYDPELEIYVSSDPEGNSFDTLRSLCLEEVIKNGYEIYITNPQDYDDGSYEGTYTPNAIVLWP